MSKLLITKPKAFDHITSNIYCIPCIKTEIEKSALHSSSYQELQMRLYKVENPEHIYKCKDIVNDIMFISNCTMLEATACLVYSSAYKALGKLERVSKNEIDYLSDND